MLHFWTSPLPSGVQQTVRVLNKASRLFVVYVPFPLGQHLWIQQHFLVLSRRSKSWHFTLISALYISQLGNILSLDTTSFPRSSAFKSLNFMLSRSIIMVAFSQFPLFEHGMHSSPPDKTLVKLCNQFCMVTSYDLAR